MKQRKHWDAVYRSKKPDAVSWYQPHLETSLRLICDAAQDLSASIIDVGGGESTLVDDLLERGYRDLTVLDVSSTALEFSRSRLGARGAGVMWLEADITSVQLPESRYDVWHDRAVFHFLTETSQRKSYVRTLRHALKPAGCVVLATFGPQGPEKCSGLDVVRYDGQDLAAELGTGFELETSFLEEHVTPTQERQQFLYCTFRKR
ncbi:Methyltransferase [Burkholderia multivorans]